MDEVSPLEKWKFWITAATFSKSKTEKMLKLISILNFTSLLLIIRQVKYLKKVTAELKLEYWSSGTPVSPGRQMVKKEVEFPGVLIKNSWGISMGLRFWPWIFCQRSVTQFWRIRKGESLFSMGKGTNLNILVGFFRKVYIYIYLLNPPALKFSGIAQYSWKETRGALHVMSPTRLPRSDLPSLI